MRNTVLVLCIALLSSMAFAQNNNQLITNVLGQDANIPASFIEGVINIDRTSICDPWDDDGPCTDLCDPWDDRPCSEQKVYGQSSAKDREELLVKTMMNLEKAMAKGSGGKYLTSKLLSQAKRKYSGKSLKSLRARFNTYIGHLKASK